MFMFPLLKVTTFIRVFESVLYTCTYYIILYIFTIQDTKQVCMYTWS